MFFQLMLPVLRPGINFGRNMAGDGVQCRAGRVQLQFSHPAQVTINHFGDGNAMVFRVLLDERHVLDGQADGQLGGFNTHGSNLKNTAHEVRCTAIK